MVDRERAVQIAVLAGACVLAALIFFWIGWASRPVPDTQHLEQLAQKYQRLRRSGRGFGVDDVPPLIQTQKLRERLQYLSAEPHITGVQGHNRTAVYFKEQLGQLEGFEIFSKVYYVALGFSGDSKFTIVYNNGTRIDSQVQEKILSPHENRTGQVNPILSFTPGGFAQGQIVYANRGTEADFEYLSKDANINLTNTIALMRYGGTGRGVKLVNAHKYGCIGGIVFSDPGDGWADPKNLSSSNVYPNSWWLPDTGVQRGSAKMRQADPQTPHYPSLDYTFRDSIDDIKAVEDPRILAPIPGYPVSYGDARMLLERLAGPDAPENFKGGLPVAYKLGGQFNSDEITHVELNSTNRIDEKVYSENIFAVMKGEIEPDRYMLVGNHRDGWGTGAVDATSGSTTVLEMASALSELYRRGWRPRRSILLCSWDAEEQGIMGSWEWVEDKFPQIKDKVVGYLNIDIAVRGSYVIRPTADPLMQKAVLQSLKNVPVPEDQVEEKEEARSKTSRSKLARRLKNQRNRRTMYNEYKEKWLDNNNTMSVPVASSDYSAFTQMAGIPVIDVSYVQEKGFYPLYHSTYETFFAVENYIDPGMKKHREVGIWGIEVVRMFADSWLLPYDEVGLVAYLQKMYDETKSPEDWGWTDAAASHKKQAISAWSAFGETLKRLKQLSDDLAASVDAIQAMIEAQDDSVDPMVVRSLNDRRMRTIQALTDHRGNPRNPTLHNVFIATTNEEVRTRFTRIPGLSDLLALAEKEPSNLERWKQVAKQASAVAFRAQSLEYQLQEQL